MFQTRVIKKFKTHFMFSNFFPKYRAVYKVQSQTIHR